MYAQTSLGETKQRILLLLLDGATTAEKLASKLKMNLSVIRRHLDDLELHNLVESTFKRMGRGRPSKYYSISTEGRGMIASRYDLVAELLTKAMDKDEGRAKSKEVYVSAGQILAATVGELKDPESLRVVLEEFGFQPQLKKEGNNELIVSKNCPFIKLAETHPELTCDAFHTAFLREVLKRPEVVLRQTIARGAAVCLHAY
jgi:predicted ArsR family transcriptional regulator